MTRIKNTTDIPDSFIKEVIDFVRPKNIGHVSFLIGNRKDCHFSGHTDTYRSVTIKINTTNNKKGKFPVYHDIRGDPYLVYSVNKLDDDGNAVSWKERIVKPNSGYLPSLILSLDEALVHILAHELRHIWQTKHTGKRGKVWNARGLHSERDADAYAIKMQRKWRREKKTSYELPYEMVFNDFMLMCDLQILR